MTVQSNKRIVDVAEAERALRQMVMPGHVFEIRALKAQHVKERRRGTVAGYFVSPTAAARALLEIRSAAAIYVTLNVVNPELHGRAFNRLRLFEDRDPTTADANILRRCWLLIDIDYERAANVSSTDLQHEAALKRATEVREALLELGWPMPLYIDSGNGAHLLYAIDLPVGDDGLVSRVLAALNTMFGGNGLKIDCSVSNPSRITKLPGTLVCKGDDTPEQPHRMSRLIDVPPVREIVGREQLEAFVASVTDEQATNDNDEGNRRITTDANSNKRFQIEAFVDRHFPEARQKEIADGRVWVIDCPWNDEHTGGCAHIIQRKDGMLGHECKHDSCRGKNWKQLRELKEPKESRRPSAGGNGNTIVKNQVENRNCVTVTAYRPFPVDVLPACLSDFITTVAKATVSDSAYAALPVITACAAAIGNSRRLRIKPGWDVPAIIWTALVGESGVGKSPPLALGVRAIKNREARLYRDHQAAMEEYEVQRLLYEKGLSAWKHDKKTEAEPPQKPIIPVAERCLVSDTTLEALAPILRDNPRGLVLVRDELAGWFGSFDRYSGKGKASADAAQWLSIFDGDDIYIDRKTGGQRIRVPRATVSVCGGIQPAILRRALADENRQNGMAARLLYAHPERRPKRWSDAGVAPEVERQFAHLLDELFRLQSDTNEYGDPEPVLVGLSRDAKRRYVSYYNDHNEVGIDYIGDMSAAWSKLEGYALRLALVVHIVRVVSGDSTIEAELIDQGSIEIAIELTQWFAYEAKRVYSLLDESATDQDARELYEWLRRHGGRTTVRDLQHAKRQFRGEGGAKEAELALNVLKKSGLGDWQVDNDAGGPGRKAFNFVLHEVATVTQFAETRELLNCVTVTSDDVAADDAVLVEPVVSGEEDLWTA